MDSKAVGKKVKELRLQSGISQDELAGMTQLSVRTIQRIENNETEARGDSLKRLAKAFQVDVAFFKEIVFEIPVREELKTDKNILILLSASPLGFLLFPLLGVLLPFIVWSIYKEKIAHVRQRGLDIIKAQAWWCCLLLGIYAYVFALKLYPSINFPRPDNQRFFIMIITVLYALNTFAILFQLLKFVLDKRIFDKPSLFVK